MAKLYIFNVFDSKAELYLPPFFFPNKGHALRAFQDAVNDPTHMFGKHPADYTVFMLGSYDEESARFDLMDAPISLGNGLEFQQRGAI